MQLPWYNGTLFCINRILGCAGTVSNTPPRDMRGIKMIFLIKLRILGCWIHQLARRTSDCNLWIWALTLHPRYYSFTKYSLRI
jgi:hypothetical protein